MAPRRLGRGANWSLETREAVCGLPGQVRNEKKEGKVVDRSHPSVTKWGKD